MLTIKFLALTHPITLHHIDEIYYLVLATILLHNIMVEECVSNNEVEDGSFYNTVDHNDDSNSTTDDDNGGGSGYERNRSNKIEMVHRRWGDLYDFDGSKKLKDTMKRHLYRMKFGDGALENAQLWMDNYNPLII